MSNKELKPCPFCGGKAKLWTAKDSFDSNGWYSEVTCQHCNARTTGNEDEAIDAWNKRVDVANTNESCEKSCKDENATCEPLVPKWVSHYSGGESLDVSISQYKKLRFRIYDTDGSSNFKYHCDCTVINFIADKDSCIFEEVGEFYTLEEAKAKANECIRKLGERLVYFANNIKTEE